MSEIKLLINLPQVINAGINSALLLRLPMANHHGRAGGFIANTNKLTCSFKDNDNDPIGCVVLSQQVDSTQGY